MLRRLKAHGWVNLENSTYSSLICHVCSMAFNTCLFFVSFVIEGKIYTYLAMTIKLHCVCVSLCVHYYGQWHCQYSPAHTHVHTHTNTHTHTRTHAPNIYIWVPVCASSSDCCARAQVILIRMYRATQRCWAFRFFVLSFDPPSSRRGYRAVHNLDRFGSSIRLFWPIHWRMLPPNNKLLWHCRKSNCWPALCFEP